MGDSMEVMVPTTIVVDQQGEKIEDSNNLEHEVPPLPKQGPAKIKTTKMFLHEKKEQRIRVTNLVLRGVALLFSFISYVIMAYDDQALDDYLPDLDYQSYDIFEAYRYCLAMGVIVFLYSAFQLGKGTYTFFKPDLFPHVVACYVDFIGDQLLAYLLLSSSSSAGSLTMSLQRIGFSRRMTNLPAASLSMSFIAFASVATSSVLSAFALAKRIRW